MKIVSIKHTLKHQVAKQTVFEEKVTLIFNCETNNRGDLISRPHAIIIHGATINTRTPTAFANYMWELVINSKEEWADKLQEKYREAQADRSKGTMD